MDTTAALEGRPSGDVEVEPVAFPSDGAWLAGNFYRPAGLGGTPLPTVMVTGTWMSIKEQMADRYAARLARHGLAALSFDFAGYGTSGGEPREVESAGRKARDMHSAVSFLASHPGVDAERIGALAICASAMYVSMASAAGDERIRALALIAPWLHDRELTETIYGGPQGVADKLNAADAALARYAQTGVVDYVPAADPGNPRAAMPMHIDFYDDPARGLLPGWGNRFAVMAWKEWLTLDAIALAPRIAVPTLIVHSPDGAIPDGARRFYQALQCDKRIEWLTGTQFDFYDQDPVVDAAASHAIAHLTHQLTPFEPALTA
jgi:uncharacterized protein